MATASKSQSATSGLFEGNKAFGDMLSAMQQPFNGPQASGLQMAERLAEETFRFWAKRMNAYADHLSALQQCQGPTEVADLSTQFINQSWSDYAEETGELVRMSQDAAAKESKKAASSAKAT